MIKRIVATASLLALLPVWPASAAEPTADVDKPMGAAEIAAELNNPNTVLGTMNFNLDITGYGGSLPQASDQTGVALGFQPVLPYPITKSVNFFLRPLIPIVFTQPVPTSGGFEHVGTDLGDISFDAAFGKSFKNGLVVVGGMVGTMPTATNGALGRDQWLLGPEGLVGWVQKWGAVGVLVTHQWDVGGTNAYSTSITGGQYFAVLNLGGGWQLRSTPPYSYNHEAPSGQRWTFPVGGGIAKTSIFGRLPVKFAVEAWYFVASPDDFGQDFQVRLSVSPVVPLPWHK